MVSPDGEWGWIIVLSSLMCNFLVDGIGQAYGVLLPTFEDFFKEPRSKVSFVGTGLNGTNMCIGRYGFFFINI